MRGGGPRSLKSEPRPTTAPAGAPRRFRPRREPPRPRAAATARGNHTQPRRDGYAPFSRPGARPPGRARRHTTRASAPRESTLDGAGGGRDGLAADTGRGTSTATTARGTRPFSRPRAARTSGPRFDASTRSSRRSRPARGASPSRRHAHLVLPSCDSAARRGGSEINKFKNQQT